MKRLLLIFMVLFSAIGYAQEDKVYPINLNNDIGAYDFSNLIVCDSVFREGDNMQKEKRTEALGFIGENYQRFYIHFTSSEKNKNNQYLVKGKTKVKENICDFEGIMNIEEVRMGYKEWIVDDIDSFNTGFVKGTYCFKEDSKQVHSGVLEGEFELLFYYDKDNKIKYNTLKLGTSDNYCNNQFNGTWTSYDNKLNMVCNWGDWLIPNSGNLNIGAGEFSPNEKYIEYGWEDYLTNDE